MREIKFRLRINNKIVGYEKWYCGHLKDGDPCSSPPCWIYSDDNKYWSPIYIYHKQKDAYIGLKDKNEVEIYENNLILHRNLMLPEIIYWHNDSSSYRRGRYGQDTQFDKSKGIISGNWLEVIGVYENPELLKKGE